MVPRFACIATSRRRRALGSSLGASALRVRRASASLRRVAALDAAAIALESRESSTRSRRDDVPAASPDRSSRR
jgi:hypothetical protein